MSHVALFPFGAVADIVAVPLPTAVTMPFLTVATLLFEDDHFSFSVALSGSMYVCILTVDPLAM